MGGLLDLAAYLGYLLHLLNGGLMAMQSILDHLGRALFFMRDFLKRSCVLLLLLEQLLVHLGSLLRLVHELADQLLAMIDLAGDGRILVQGLVLVHVVVASDCFGLLAILNAETPTRFMMRRGGKDYSNMATL